MLIRWDRKYYFSFYLELSFCEFMLGGEVGVILLLSILSLLSILH